MALDKIFLFFQQKTVYIFIAFALASRCDTGIWYLSVLSSISIAFVHFWITITVILSGMTFHLKEDSNNVASLYGHDLFFHGLKTGPVFTSKAPAGWDITFHRFLISPEKKKKKKKHLWVFTRSSSPVMFQWAPTLSWMNGKIFICVLSSKTIPVYQFQMQLPEQGLNLLNQNMLTVLSHGGLLEHAKILYCHVRCQVAMAAKASEQKRKGGNLSVHFCIYFSPQVSFKL